MAHGDDTPDIGKPEAAATSRTDLEAENAWLRGQIAAREEIIAKLLARVAELERRLGLDSSNSGKPPSSDGLKKPRRTRSLREASGRKPGGQKGHPGTTLRRTEHPDAIVNHLPGMCPACGEALGLAESVGYLGRQIFDLPDPQPFVVTEHRAHECRAERRHGRSSPRRWRDRSRYGPNIAAVAAYLSAVQLLPEERIAQLLHDLHRIDVSAASIATMIGRKAAELGDFAAAVGHAVRTAPVKHADETGVRVGGALHWLQVAATTVLTFYRVTRKPARSSPT